MNKHQLKQLETDLWTTADKLRANSKLTAAEYKDPLLGLILLRYAQNRFEKIVQELEAETPINPRTGQKPPIEKAQVKAKNTIWLDEKARYEHLASLAGDNNINAAVTEAMRLIEADNPELSGVLPKNYQNLEKRILDDVIRLFSEDRIKKLPGDVIGRIYEFFLMKFSMIGAGAQEGGEFFTPPSLVQTIVNFIEPRLTDSQNEIIVHDPACGSGGMFVQTGHFIEQQGKETKGVRVFGTELKTNNVKLAKMNLAIHGIEGEIIESNSFTSDPHNLIGRCDFVMANPPFNVKQVAKDSDYVKNDKRLFQPKEKENFSGIPKADNGNYLWIQYFYHYLNEQGRAGFVMASSATDAGNTEKAIRQKLIETGAVDCIVSIANNFFYTLSLPCHLWFFDKNKRAENQDKILMIDARNTYRKVNTTLNDFSDGQQVNFTAIMQAYRGDAKAINNAVIAHQSNLSELNSLLSEFAQKLKQTCYDLVIASESLNSKLKSCIADLTTAVLFSGFDSPEAAEQAAVVFDNPVPELTAQVESLSQQYTAEKAALDLQLKQAKENSDKTGEKALKDKKKPLEALLRELKTVSNAVSRYQQEAKEDLADFKQAVRDWQALLGYFPDLRYQDVEGLCKVVDLQEVAANDWSLTPGRYVGYSVAVDDGFDYQARMAAIHAELAVLHSEANGLMAGILESNL